MPFPVVACDAAACRRFGRGDTANGGRNGAVHSLRGVHSTGGRPVFQEFERAVAAQNGMTVRLSAEIRQLREQLPGLLRGTECPRAAFVQDNETAVELLHLLRREELRVPEDIEILCQQNTKLAKLADPALSVLAPTGYQVGMVGAKCLMDHLDRGDTLAPLQLVAPIW